MSSQSTKVARCCMQQLYSAGAFHPSVAADLRDALAQRFEPADYPPTFLYARGFRCGCLDFFTDPCRMEFRRVRIRLLCLRRWTLFTPFLAEVCCGGAGYRQAVVNFRRTQLSTLCHVICTSNWGESNEGQYIGQPVHAPRLQTHLASWQEMHVIMNLISW